MLMTRHRSDDQRDRAPPIYSDEQPKRRQSARQVGILSFRANSSHKRHWAEYTRLAHTERAREVPDSPEKGDVWWRTPRGWSMAGKGSPHSPASLGWPARGRS